MRYLSLGMLVALALFAAWRIIGNSIADSSAATAPEAALAWRADHAPALLTLAQRQLGEQPTQQQWNAVEQLAGAALAANPLDPVALRLLALAADNTGDVDTADRLMRLAAARSLRDPAAHIWLFNRSLTIGRFDRTVRHADVVIRSFPSLRDQFLPTLIALASNDAGRPVMAAMLGEAPPWRPWFLAALSRQAVDVSLPSALYLALKETANPPTHAELGAHLMALINAGRYAAAYIIWKSFVDPGESGTPPLLSNGSFEEPVSGLAFDWSIETIRGADSRIVDYRVADEVEKALKIDFAIARVPFSHVRKLLLLPPGRFELTGQVRAERLRSERGFTWQVTCAGAETAALGGSERFAGDIAWRPFSFTFEVPVSNCRAQWLILEHAARVALEQQINGGALWFDALDLQRLEPDLPSALEGSFESFNFR